MVKNNQDDPRRQLFNQKINFSFLYYDNRKKYCLSTWGPNDIHAALFRLKGISSLSRKELYNSRYFYAYHEVNWKDSKIEPNGFPFKDLDSLPAWQFKLPGINDQKARVFGTFIEGIFYIVWFDYDHQILPSKLKNT